MLLSDYLLICVLISLSRFTVGGQDFDNRLVEHFAKEFEQKNHVEISKNPKALRKLKEKAQEAKHILSLNTKVLFSAMLLPFLIPFRLLLK